LFIVILETPSIPSTDIFLSVLAWIVFAFITSVISKPVVSLIDSIVFARTEGTYPEITPPLKGGAVFVLRGN